MLLCFPCLGERGRGGNCQQEGVVYRLTCLECGLNQVKSEYTAETSRTAFLRGREHQEGLDKRNVDNVLWKHCATVHGGQVVQFKMKVIKSHRTPLSRQVQESIEIEYSKADIVMNSKGEWNGSRIPRIVVEVGEKLQEGEKEEQKNTERSRDWPEEERMKKKGQWKIENLKKRKREEEGELQQVKKIKECMKLRE